MTEEHNFRPDLMAMGDCAVCGRPHDDPIHESPVASATAGFMFVDYDSLTEKEVHENNQPQTPDLTCGDCQRQLRPDERLTEVNPEGGYDRARLLICDDCLRQERWADWRLEHWPDWPNGVCSNP